MSALSVGLDVAVLAMLIAMLVRATRLERALGVLRHERAAWEAAVGGLGAGTRDAQAGLLELRQTADGVGREVAQQSGRASGLKDDLTFLIERSEAACNRLELSIRASRPAPAPLSAPEAGIDRPDLGRRISEQELLAALRLAR